MRELTVANAADLKEELLAELGKNGVAAFDVSDLETVDFAGFQLIVALWREAARRNVTVRLTGTLNRDISARLNRLGLSEIPIESGEQLTDYFSRLCN